MSVSSSSAYDYSVSTTQKREEEAKNSAYGTSTTDFLTLLIAQLTNQDPLNPMEDTDFTSQLAQLQSLEEQMAMTKSINAMRMDNQVQTATDMIGKEVTGLDAAGNTVTGTVKQVLQTSDDVFVVLTSGVQLSVSNVTKIVSGDSTTGSNLANSANYIGKFIEAGYDSAMQPIKGIVESVSVEGGKVMLNLYGGTSVSWDSVTSMRAPTESESWYTYPDSVRENVEKAQGMLGMVVTGTNSNGETVTGIVADAQLASDNKVYLILFDGSVINIDDVDGEAAEPTAEDIARDLKGLYAKGLDGEGNSIEGVIVGAEERDDGTVILLDNGGHFYLEYLQEISDVPDGYESPSTGETDGETEAESNGETDG